jgi:hypothetical protein
MNGWVGFDFDGALVKFPSGNGKTYGADNEEVVSFLRTLKQSGIEVRIFSARAGNDGSRAIVQGWLIEHGLSDVAITDRKDFSMAALLDDLAITIDPATGQVMTHPSALNTIMARIGVRIGEPAMDKSRVPETKVKVKKDNALEGQNLSAAPVGTVVHKTVTADSVSVTVTPAPLGVGGSVTK